MFFSIIIKQDLKKIPEDDGYDSGIPITHAPRPKKKSVMRCEISAENQTQIDYTDVY